MKQVSELKKGDIVTITYGYVGSEDLRNKPTTAVVDSVGRKYIKVRQTIDGKPIGDVLNFDIENLTYTEWSHRHLFLGTVEELVESRKQVSMARELINYISAKLSINVPYEKLKAIKDIIDSPTLDAALAKICPPACACCD